MLRYDIVLVFVLESRVEVWGRPHLLGCGVQVASATRLDRDLGRYIPPRSGFTDTRRIGSPTCCFRQMNTRSRRILRPMSGTSIHFGFFHCGETYVLGDPYGGRTVDESPPVQASLPLLSKRASYNQKPFRISVIRI
jgi:hypothetical protein